MGSSGTYGFCTDGEIQLLFPVPRYPCQDILLRDVSYSGLVVLLRIIPEHYTLDFVLRLAEPAFFHVV